MKTETEAAAELAKQSAIVPHTVTVTDGDEVRQVIAVPQTGGTWDIRSAKKALEEYRDAPERRKGIATLTDLDSFIAHVNRFKDEDSAIFATRVGAPGLLCIFDYHRKTHEGAPRFGEHRARYAFPLSKEWQAWLSMDGKSFSQEEFARWLEDHLQDVTAPDTALENAKEFLELFHVQFASPSKLLAMSRDLTVNVGASIHNHQNLSSGEIQIAYSTKHIDEKGAPVTFPGAFLITIPPFVEGIPYQVPARLRYRLKEGTITWSYQLYRTQAYLDDAVDADVKRCVADTQLPAFSGSPEA